MSINIVFTLFLVVALISVRKVSHPDSEAVLWTRLVSDSIKGVAALLIVLHHVSWKMYEANALTWVYREINLLR